MRFRIVTRKLKIRNMSDKIKLGLAVGLLALYFGINYLPQTRNEQPRQFDGPLDTIAMTTWFGGEDMWYAVGSDTINADSKEGRRLLLEHPQRRVRLKIEPVGSEK